MKQIILAFVLLLPAAAHAQIMFGSATVIDGDTLDLGPDRIRLHGIDALEGSQTCNRDGQTWECGKDATALLSSLVIGKSVQCEQRDRDAYGRVVATCSAGGLDLSRAMVEAGFAVALPQYSIAYVETEKRMRSLKVGMWASEFQMPADYRSANPHLTPPPRQPKALPPPTRVPDWTQRSNPPSGDVFYRYCADARAAGAAPIYRGQPGYRPELDRDGDGVACEPYRGRR